MAQPDDEPPPAAKETLGVKLPAALRDAALSVGAPEGTPAPVAVAPSVAAPLELPKTTAVKVGGMEPVSVWDAGRDSASGEVMGEGLAPRLSALLPLPRHEAVSSPTLLVLVVGLSDGGMVYVAEALLAALNDGKPLPEAGALVKALGDGVLVPARLALLAALDDGEPLSVVAALLAAMGDDAPLLVVVFVSEGDAVEELLPRALREAEWDTVKVPLTEALALGAEEGVAPAEDCKLAVAPALRVCATLAVASGTVMVAPGLSRPVALALAKLERLGAVPVELRVRVLHGEAVAWALGVA